MKVMNLHSQESIAGRKPFIVIGTLTVHGEEVSSRGKVLNLSEICAIYVLSLIPDCHL